MTLCFLPPACTNSCLSYYGCKVGMPVDFRPCRASGGTWREVIGSARRKTREFPRQREPASWDPLPQNIACDVQLAAPARRESSSIGSGCGGGWRSGEFGNEGLRACGGSTGPALGPSIPTQPASHQPAANMTISCYLASLVGYSRINSCI